MTALSRLGNSQEVYSYKGYRIEMFTSLVNDRWQASVTIRGGADTLNLFTLGYDTKDTAEKAIWEEAKRKIAAVSSRSSQGHNAAKSSRLP